MRILAAAVMLIFAAGCAALPAHAALSAAPSRAVFTGLALRDPSVMQSFAYDPVHRVWIFAQLTWGQSASSGDLTLTRVSASGARLGWMHLRGFGHGLAVGAEPCGATTCVWAETHGVAEPGRGWALPGTYGDQIARFAWRNSATLNPSSAGVERFGVNAGAPEQTPSVDVADGLIAVQYWSAGLRAFRWAVYSLSKFKKHSYTALARFTVPAQLARNGLTEQGWALAGRGTLVNWQGEAKPASDATFSTVTTSGAAVSVLSTAGAGLSYREPEGAAMMGGAACTGFASGPAGARRANVYCLHRDDHQPPVVPGARARRHPVLRGEGVSAGREDQRMEERRTDTLPVRALQLDGPVVVLRVGRRPGDAVGHPRGIHARVPQAAVGRDDAGRRRGRRHRRAGRGQVRVRARGGRLLGGDEISVDEPRRDRISSRGYEDLTGGGGLRCGALVEVV